MAQAGIEPRSAGFEADAFTTRLTMYSQRLAAAALRATRTCTSQHLFTHVDHRDPGRQQPFISTALKPLEHKDINKARDLPGHGREGEGGN